MISTNQSGQTFPGLTLKAWVLHDAAGAIQKSQNVSGVVLANSAYTVTFSVAMASAKYMVKSTAMIQYPGSGNATLGGAGGGLNVVRAAGNCLVANYAKPGDTIPQAVDTYTEFWE